GSCDVLARQPVKRVGTAPANEGLRETVHAPLERNTVHDKPQVFLEIGQPGSLGRVQAGDQKSNALEPAINLREIEDQADREFARQCPRGVVRIESIRNAINHKTINVPSELAVNEASENAPMPPLEIPPHISNIFFTRGRFLVAGPREGIDHDFVTLFHQERGSGQLNNSDETLRFPE